MSNKITITVDLPDGVLASQAVSMDMDEGAAPPPPGGGEDDHAASDAAAPPPEMEAGAQADDSPPPVEDAASGDVEGDGEYPPGFDADSDVVEDAGSDSAPPPPE
ncbi:hypothetical protein ROA7450_02940 [Roseovarius albus]|uniref:Uncharacterized protein n=1 Tax=Roseovarius albus TaxID=1247867 RepID=A0A1X6ZNT8_9RHOB|nr:hypothetical protein [Roseovarius albus]SLN56721.1 hypothetical protein ROA7450_02940 [Roseovarius albus]